MRIRAGTAALPLLLLVAPLASRAAAAAPVKQAEFEERIDVVEVEVPVEVFDREGRPVRGLTAADFRLFDDGKPAAIERFEAVDLELLSEQAKAAAPASPALIAQPRHLLLLFDLTFADPIAIGKARLAARELVLESLHPSDLVAVATFTVEQGPRLLVTFTPDRAQVARAVDSLSFDRASEARALDPLRFMVPLAATGAPESGTGAESRGSDVRNEIATLEGETAEILGEMAEREGRRYDTSRVMTWTRGLGDLARFLATVSGRKQVLLFSEGFDSKLLLGRSDLTEIDAAAETQNATFGQIWRVDSDLRYGNTPLMNESTRMVEELRRADCVVHAVDIGGLRAAGVGERFGRSIGEESLFFFANGSGGQLFTDANDLGSQLREVLARTSSSYLLGFRAEKIRADGAWRKLKVELVDRRGLKLVHRAGWYAPRPFPELHPFERDLLAADAIAIGAPKNEIGIALLAAPFRAGDAGAYVPVILEIDGASLLGTGTRPRRVDLYAYATTREGEFRDFFHRDLRIDPRRTNAAFSAGGLKYYGHFELAPGDYVLRVLVRDGDSGRVGTTMAPMRVPDFTRQTATLLPPFFFDPPGRWTMVRERTETSSDGSVVYPFVIGGDPYVPAAGPRFSGGDSPAVAVVGYHLGDAELTLAASLVTPEGERPALLAAAQLETGSDGVFHWKGELDLGGVPAGDHRIRVEIFERASGRRVASSESPLRVEG